MNSPQKSIFGPFFCALGRETSDPCSQIFLKGKSYARLKFTQHMISAQILAMGLVLPSPSGMIVGLVPSQHLRFYWDIIRSKRSIDRVRGGAMMALGHHGLSEPPFKKQDED